MLDTAVKVPLGRLYPGRMSVQLDTSVRAAKAALPMPEGQGSTTALALYTPVEAEYGVAKAVGLLSEFVTKAPSRPGQ